jgi:hypothetical protein
MSHVIKGLYLGWEPEHVEGGLGSKTLGVQLCVCQLYHKKWGKGPGGHPSASSEAACFERLILRQLTQNYSDRSRTYSINGPCKALNYTLPPHGSLMKVLHLFFEYSNLLDKGVMLERAESG